MTNSSESVLKDVEKVKSIPIVQTMLEVICRTTGMGFAAIARVTDNRWIACSVRDEVQFGLEAGGELKVETTLCNEVRVEHRAIVIDHVKEDKVYFDHHTPKMYGLQSYISFPIVLKTGEFFGTLCALDAKPADLNNSKVLGMFSLFAELISFHLQSMDNIEQSRSTHVDLTRQLKNSTYENRQYQYISNHNLQEPLRKLRLFSDRLVEAMEAADLTKAREYAAKVNSSAQKFSMIIKDLSDFSELTFNKEAFETIDLNIILSDVCAQLKSQLDAANAFVQIDDLPVIRVIPFQMEQLFYHLIENALKFSKPGVPPIIRLSCRQLELSDTSNVNQFEIRLEDNGVGIEKSQLEKVFDIFSKQSMDGLERGFGIGLAYCRKIIHHHRGTIKAESEVGKGTVFTLTLPITRD